MSQRETVARELALLLLKMGAAVRSAIAAGVDSMDRRPLGQRGGDTIYALDHRVEPIVLREIEAWPAHLKPVLVVAEGLGDGGVRRIGAPPEPVKYRVLIDPVDGTRGLMYDKRSAWFLASAVPDDGDGTLLSRACAAAICELPTTKQALGDEFAASDGAPLLARRVNLATGETRPLAPAPSREGDLRHGFAHAVSFFPGTMTLAAELMETIAEATLGQVDPGEALMFNDQYISTGGQFVELMMGRDRFCCDLRPLFHEIMERRLGRPVSRGMVCHPYDIAGLKVAEADGVILTDGFGRPLDTTLTVSGAIHWCGYANATLRARIEPVVQDWLSRQLPRHPI